mgnify:CR=1 FL=1
MGDCWRTGYTCLTGVLWIILSASLSCCTIVFMVSWFAPTIDSSSCTRSRISRISLS